VSHDFVAMYAGSDPGPGETFEPITMVYGFASKFLGIGTRAMRRAIEQLQAEAAAVDADAIVDVRVTASSYWLVGNTIIVAGTAVKVFEVDSEA
jgi:uncharacterized protein YbjQ (UPF0145 family)